MHQPAHCRQISARGAAFGIWPKRAAYVVMVIQHQVHADVFLQFIAPTVQTQRLGCGAVEADNRTRLILHLGVDQRNFGGLGVIAKKL
jgi:hypothetical protein